jgi:hypothetical protein
MCRSVTRTGYRMMTCHVADHSAYRSALDVGRKRGCYRVLRFMFSDHYN